jgi:hypothetical protein
LFPVVIVLSQTLIFLKTFRSQVDAVSSSIGGLSSPHFGRPEARREFCAIVEVAHVAVF